MYSPPAYASFKPGGLLICSTPYHGYLKNCVLALTGNFDAHFTALWNCGHIKFWSRGAGRWPWLWKSMLIAARKPLPPGARLSAPAPAARPAQAGHGSEQS